ncbi:hypothetical protein POM88_034985 [Heracleum sosnowskyi]|uniref:Protein kinase domain-containing protein n=1 Tax=Heracleum sosnowskyi TaxID=360622 RepID=A0AAD8HM76_9APIA|nr:hypothetical protein POM88_034985 [Heracleum sosnowskyi]
MEKLEALRIGSFVVIMLLLLASSMFCRCMRKRKTKELEGATPNYTSKSFLKRFHPKELEFATDQFNEDSILGPSSMSTVYKGVLEDGHVITIQKLKVHQYAVTTEKNFNRELKTLGKVSIARGLVYLYSPGNDFPLVHCDLKPTNVLVDGEWNVSVSDFGTARILGTDMISSSSSTVSVFEGTIGYLAPEYAFIEFLTRQLPTGLSQETGQPITLPQLVKKDFADGSDRLLSLVDPQLVSEISMKEQLEKIFTLPLSCTCQEPEGSS